MNGKNRFHAWNLGLAMLFLLNAGYTQGLLYPPRPHPIKSFAATVGGDALYVFSSPFRLKKGDGLKILAFTAMTGIFVASLDNTVNNNFIERNDFYVIPAVGLAKIGEGYNYVLAGLPVSMFAGGLIFQDKKLLLTTRLMVEAYIITGVITQAGKRVFGRERPFESEGPSEFEWFQLTSSASHSFPSGHSAGVFSIMTVLAKQYKAWWIKIPAYAVALSVAFQRIESRNHWGTDVIVGGAIGYWVGSALVSRYRKQSNNLLPGPYILANRVGVIIRL